MQPSTKVRRKNGRNGREGRRQNVTPRLRAGIRWAAEYRVLNDMVSDPHGNVLLFTMATADADELALKQFQLS